MSTRKRDDDDDLDEDEDLIPGGEGKAETTEQHAARTYPYLNLAAVQGGVVIGTEDMKVTRPMSQDDLMDAAEEQSKVAHRMEDAEQQEIKFEGEAKSYKRLLDGARENTRKAIAQQKECGQELKAIAFEIETRTRIVTTKVNITITPQNEAIVVDAETNQEIERRNATSAEIEKSRNRTPTLFSAPPDGKPAGGDSASSKNDPEAKPVILSMSAAGQAKVKKSIREGLSEVPYPGQEGPDAECLAVHWSASAPDGMVSELGRLYATVPTWAARRLRVVAEGQKALELVELTSADK